LIPLEVADEGWDVEVFALGWLLAALAGRCGTTNEGVAHLAGLSKLRGLRLSTRQAEDTADLDSPTSLVNDDAMDAIGQLTNLQVLALDNLVVSEAGLAKLKNLQQLKELYLAGT
jgi:hypothetical protein